MFGISFAKILLLVAVVAAVWLGFKYLTRQSAPGPRVKAKREADKGLVEDMVRCAVCGAFQARAAGPCGRQDCPGRT